MFHPKKEKETNLFYWKEINVSFWVQPMVSTHTINTTKFTIQLFTIDFI